MKMEVDQDSVASKQETPWYMGKAANRVIYYPPAKSTPHPDDVEMKEQESKKRKRKAAIKKENDPCGKGRVSSIHISLDFYYNLLKT